MKKVTPKTGTKKKRGACLPKTDVRKKSINAEIRRLQRLPGNLRHVRGPLFKNASNRVYDPSQILNRQSFFFEPALSLPYLSQDCMIFAVDYAFRYPVFTNRRQVHRLAKRVLKRADKELMDVKASKGYNLSMFSEVVAT